jgi:hypothetical protein
MTEIIVDPRTIVRKKSKRRYLNGVDFHNALVEYYKLLVTNPNAQIPNYIGLCIKNIAVNLGNKINFSAYSFKEEMIGDAIQKMVEAVVYQKYDALISQNPFAYFSQIAYNQFLQRIKFEKREIYIKHENFENLEFDDMESVEKLFTDDEHRRILDNFKNPKKKENSLGYSPHANLSYKPNRERKGRKPKCVDNEDKKV